MINDFPDTPRALLGKDVKVKLDDTVVAQGRLIAFDDAGECVLVDEMGFTHWCWPMLEIEAA
jgi:small nuclear ribonucleoprotein (snRNP)-like protein